MWVESTLPAWRRWTSRASAKVAAPCQGPAARTVTGLRGNANTAPGDNDRHRQEREKRQSGVEVETAQWNANCARTHNACPHTTGGRCRATSRTPSLTRTCDVGASAGREVGPSVTLLAQVLRDGLVGAGIELNGLPCRCTSVGAGTTFRSRNTHQCARTTAA
jgi:hypothetical protein